MRSVWPFTERELRQDLAVIEPRVIGQCVCDPKGRPTEQEQAVEILIVPVVLDRLRYLLDVADDIHVTLSMLHCADFKQDAANEHDGDTSIAKW